MSIIVSGHVSISDYNRWPRRIAVGTVRSSSGGRVQEVAARGSPPTRWTDDLVTIAVRAAHDCTSKGTGSPTGRKGVERFAAHLPPIKKKFEDLFSI